MKEVSLVNTVLRFLDLFLDLSDEWAKIVESDEKRFSWEEAELYASFFRWWLGCAESVLEQVRQQENDGHKVVGADDLREAHKEISLMRLDTKLAKLQHEVTTTISFDEAMRRLRNGLDG